MQRSHLGECFETLRRAMVDHYDDDETEDSAVKFCQEVRRVCVLVIGRSYVGYDVRVSGAPVFILDLFHFVLDVQEDRAKGWV
jgi:hypothetical protein